MRLLSDKMHNLLDSGKATLSDLADVLGRSATQDARGVYLAPAMIRLSQAKGAAEPPSGVSYIEDWVKGGAHRSNNDDDAANMDDGPALALFDTWYEQLVHGVFDDELGQKGFDLLAGDDAPVVNYRPSGGGGFWFDMSTYIRNLLDGRTRDKRFARDLCNDRKTKVRETCASQVRAALKRAKAQLKEAQGADISQWTVPAENIVFQELGAGSVDPIPWQNRGSENHLVEVLSDADGG
jgi:hypothetical protein